MCVPIETERAARSYIDELVRARYGVASNYERAILQWAQKTRGWLLDYDKETCLRIKPNIDKPGMKVINASIREVTKTMVRKLATVA